MAHDEQNLGYEIEYVYCKSYRNRAGKLMIAAHYGKKAWCFPIRRKLGNPDKH